MTIAGRKTTREDFARAVLCAQSVVSKLHPRSKFAHWCEKFLDANKKAIEEHEKKHKKAVSKFQTELKDFMIDHAVEKDGAILFDEKGNYRFNKTSEKEVLKKTDEINEKIQAVEAELLQEEIIVKTVKDSFKLPDNVDYHVEKFLNGFAFKNKNEFEEEVREEVEEEVA